MKSHEVRKLRNRLAKLKELILYYKEKPTKKRYVLSLETQMNNLVQRLELILEGDDPHQDVPTPEEIEKATAEIRATWTPKVTRRRRVTKSPLKLTAIRLGILQGRFYGGD